MQPFDLDKRPSKPVIPSFMGAVAQANQWLREHRHDEIYDADGLAWALKISTKQLPSRLNTKGTLWEITLSISAEVTASGFVASGTLDPARDQRLIHLIGDAAVPLAMRPVQYMAESDDAARKILSEAVQALAEDIKSKSMHPLKRSLIGRYIDQKSQFTYPSNHGSVK